MRERESIGMWVWEANGKREEGRVLMEAERLKGVFGEWSGE